MIYKILADIIVLVHFAWILFMLAGFIFTLRGFFHKEFFQRWIFRILHLFGIAYVSVLVIMGKYCPLTVWENTLRAKYAPHLTYPGSFMIYYFEKFVYPDVNPLIIQIPTTLIAVFTVVIFIFKPPAKVKNIFKRLLKIIFSGVFIGIIFFGGQAIAFDEEERFFMQREEMVKAQVEARGIKDAGALSAMFKVKRHLFVALMTELSELKGGEKVLEIGTDSGYQELKQLKKIKGEIVSRTVIPVRFVPMLRGGESKKR